jgi:hypothetical protein
MKILSKASVILFLLGTMVKSGGQTFQRRDAQGIPV